MRRYLAVFMIMTLAGAATAAPPGSDNSGADKTLILDGSIVHDVGRLHLNITNFGLIGSWYSGQTSFSHAPSGRWPGPDGVNHLWGAGLWVAGIQDGERRVSTGQYESEIRASGEPEDIIYESSWLDPQAQRYPFDDPDDDLDGLEDEDPPNGYDDDLDGQVDEDGAGISDQHFRAGMTDTYSTDAYPDHEPLDLVIVQNSLQWAADEVADFVGFEYVIRNQGAATIEQLYIGMFSDFDIDDPEGGAGEASDDQVGFATATVEAYPGELVDVEVAFAYEGSGAAVSGYMGWLPVGNPTDPAGVDAPTEVGVRAFQRFSGQAPFDQGGDPTNDNERYEAVSEDNIDPDSIGTADYRNLISVGPFAALAPGEEMSVSFVLVAGADLEEMLRNAGRARLVHEGMAFDRDGDPANGDEFVVRWLGPEEIAVPVDDPGEEPDDTPSSLHTARLDAAPNPFNPSLEVKASLPRAGWARATVLDARGRSIRVLHDGAAVRGENVWLWDGRDAMGRGMASGVYLVRLETAERVLQRAVTLVK